MVGEFELIDCYFNWPAVGRGVLIPVGDDAAVTMQRPGWQLATTVDTLVEGVHFLSDCPPEALGHKALAVSLSDLAAMGAEPLWFTLALTLPTAEPSWLEPFSNGLRAIAERFGIDLVGGDTTRGPLTVTITATGELPAGGAVRRGGAEVGDSIWLSGTIGDAALALAALQERRRVATEQLTQLRNALERPLPRVADGLALRGTASAMIDLSDGLIADLGHIVTASGRGAEIDLDKLPLSDSYRTSFASQPVDGLLLALGGGDDYQLLCTIPAGREQPWFGSRPADDWSRIGTITAGNAIRFVGEYAAEIAMDNIARYRHFVGEQPV